MLKLIVTCEERQKNEHSTPAAVSNVQYSAPKQAADTNSLRTSHNSAMLSSPPIPAITPADRPK
jgi:hypothetical protein